MPGRGDSKSKGPDEGTHIGFLWHEAAMWEKGVSEVGRRRKRSLGVGWPDPVGPFKP